MPSLNRVHGVLFHSTCNRNDNMVKVKIEGQKIKFVTIDHESYTLGSAGFPHFALGNLPLEYRSPDFSVTQPMIFDCVQRRRRFALESF